ncbi:hypothetical protein BKA66DRAFT_302358 [Pyrenochaeta sp. MPI-SDFR-AT-0127]|nr:hypothetical protein BKA66DRAFT_302358 [Pyrenochaeta sp. MPI-SDFR-AT-0127]
MSCTPINALMSPPSPTSRTLLLPLLLLLLLLPSFQRTHICTMRIYYHTHISSPTRSLLPFFFLWWYGSTVSQAFPFFIGREFQRSTAGEEEGSAIIMGKFTRI